MIRQNRMGRWFGTCAASLLALGLSACSNATAPTGVLHLDPRLADGRSSAEALAGLSVEVRVWDFTASQNAAWKPALVPFEDRSLRAWDWEANPEAGQPAIDTTTVDGVGWRASLERSTRARIEWRRSDDPPGSWPPECAAELSVDADPGGESEVRLELGGHPAWTGEVVALRLAPDGLLGLASELTRVELDQRGFWGGFEPLGEGEGLPASDGGLVSLNDFARRSWPTDFSVPLFVEAEVPKDGALLFDLALGPEHRDSLERIHLAVDVAKSGTDGLSDDGWERVWYRSIVPRLAPVETLWHGFRVDLDDHGGDAVRLRFRAWSGHGKDSVAKGLDGELKHAAVFWGTPELIAAPGAAPLPNILLVTLDTTRADLGGAQTPYFDELREGGIVFTDSLSTSNATQPSHASILTGTFPDDHGVHDNYALLAGANRTLAERLRELGYHTAAAVSQRYLGAGCGFGQGFDEFLQASPNAAEDGGETIRTLRTRVAEWSSLAPDRPVFLWLHLFDAHTPYTAPAGFAASHAERFGAPPAKTVPAGDPRALPSIDLVPEEFAFLAGSNSLEFARHLYAVEVSYSDGLVENLASSLAEGGLLGRTAFFVTADHGESLGEHQSYFNHQGILSPSVEVPLFLRVPGGPAGLTLDVPTSGVDLAPTILRYAAAGRPVDLSGLRGRDLLAGLVTAPQDVSETKSDARFLEHSGRRQLGVRRGQWQLVRTLADDMRLGIEVFTDTAGRRLPREIPIPQGVQLFDLEADPGMLVDVAAGHPDQVRELEAELDAWIAGAWNVAAGAKTARDTTPAERDELDKLGY